MAKIKNSKLVDWNALSYIVDNVKTLVNSIKENLITGVKGNAESTYRTGKVNITADNIGAISVKKLTNENLNDIKTPGFYYAAGGNSVSNKPPGVKHFGLMCIRSAEGCYTHILYSPADNTEHKRTYEGSWDAWTQPIYGIKGNNETSYRTGNVNITPANIGAATSTQFDELNSSLIKMQENVDNLKDVTGISFDSAFGHRLSGPLSYEIEIGLGETSPPNYCLKYNGFTRDEYGSLIENEIGGIVYRKQSSYLLRYKIVRSDREFNSLAEVVDLSTGNVTQSESKTFYGGYYDGRERGYIIARERFEDAPKFSANNCKVFYEKRQMDTLTNGWVIELVNSISDESNMILKSYGA